MKQMVEAVFTPAHADTLESLLNQPLAGTFNQAAANSLDSAAKKGQKNNIV
jgi:hypothetical protein